MGLTRSQPPSPLQPSPAIAHGLSDEAHSGVPTLRALQRAELQVLREFERLCAAHGLRWFLIEGTLLGAARHGGFIPWDDDVDVGMPRPDYERFVTACSPELSAPFVWEDCRNNRAYPFLFGKLLRTDTTRLERGTEHLSIAHHIGIDVFPIDGTPRLRVARVLHNFVLRTCIFRLGAQFRWRGIKRVCAAVVRVMPRSAAIKTVEILSAGFPYDLSEFVVNCGSAYGYRRETMPRAWYGKGARLRFEDSDLPVPQAWDLVLRHVYGDYMTPPPEATRSAPHDLTAVRLPRSDGGEAEYIHL